MLDIAAHRAEIAAALGTAFKDLAVPVRIYEFVPERPSFPSATITEADDEFVTPGDVFGSYVVTWKVLLVERASSSNEILTRNADDHLTLILDALDAYSPTVSGYATATHAGQPYLTIPVTLTTVS